MSFYGFMIRKAVFPLLGPLYNRHFPDMLRRWEASQTWAPEELAVHRWRRCRRLLEHAARTVPFYREHFRSNGLTLDDFQSFDDLRHLPVLGKDDYHRHDVKHFVSERAEDAARESTSGTTGRPFAFYIDKRVEASKMARLLRENRWAGWEPGDLYLRLWGPHRESKAKKLFYDGVMRRHVVSAFGLERRLDEVVATFRRLRPRIIEAYTSAAVQLARLCRDRGIELPRAESIIVSAETLMPAHRRLIEEYLGGTVYNRYGSREFGNVAHECSRGGFHIHAESFHVEEEAHPEIPGAYHLVITFFDNYTMPFLRYRIGDLGRLSHDTCSCGLTLPLLGSVEGRTTDFFTCGSEQISFLYFNHFFEQYGGIVDQYQVEQLARDHLEVRLLPGPGLSAEMPSAIARKLAQDFEDAVRFTVEVASELPREASGKLRTYRALRDPVPGEEVS